MVRHPKLGRCPSGRPPSGLTFLDIALHRNRHMKRLDVTIIVAAALLSACEGPIGPPGHDGINGLDGKDGVNANTVCLTCHASTNMALKNTQYESSKHFTGNTSGRMTRRDGVAAPAPRSAEASSSDVGIRSSPA